MKKSFIASVASFSVPTLVSAFVAVFCIPLVSYLVPAGDFAVINLFFDYGVLFALLCQLGSGEAFIRFYNEADDRSKRRLFSLSLLIGLVLVVLLGVIVSVFFPKGASRILFGQEDPKLLILLTLYVVGVLLYKFTSYRCRMDENARQYNIEQILYIIINRVAYVVPFLLVGGALSAVFFMTGLTLAMGIIALMKEPKPVLVVGGSGSGRILSRLIRYGLPMTFLAASTNALITLNKVILANMASFDDAGVFALSLTIANCFSLIPAAFNVYWATYVYKNHDEKQDEIRRMHDCVMALTLVIVAVIFLLQNVIFFFVGSQYEASQKYFMLVMMLPIQSFIAETTSYGINLSTKTYINALVIVVALAVDVLLCILLIPHMQAMGAAIALAVGSITMLVLRSVFAQRFYRTISHPVKSAAGMTLIIALCAANCLWDWGMFERFLITATFLVFTLALYRGDFCFMTSYLRNALRRSRVE